MQGHGQIRRDRHIRASVQGRSYCIWQGDGMWVQFPHIVIVIAASMKMWVSKHSGGERMRSPSSSPLHILFGHISESRSLHTPDGEWEINEEKLLSRGSFLLLAAISRSALARIRIGRCSLTHPLEIKQGIIHILFEGGKEKVNSADVNFPSANFPFLLSSLILCVYCIFFT